MFIATSMNTDHVWSMIIDIAMNTNHVWSMIIDIAMNIDRQWSLIMSIITHDQWSLPWNAVDHTWSVLINGLYRDPYSEHLKKSQNLAGTLLILCLILVQDNLDSFIKNMKPLSFHLPDFKTNLNFFRHFHIWKTRPSLRVKNRHPQ